MSQLSLFEMSDDLNNYENSSITQTDIEEIDMRKPLPERLRPKTLDDYVGQKHLIGEGKILRNLIDNDIISSMIFWGPPGVGKTTLAKIIANTTKSKFIEFSAVISGIKEIKDVMNEASKNNKNGQRTILFIDEIHRFNKAQQDAFLPFVEKGSIILIGATTENPSFEINNALLSRCKVFVLKQVESDEIFKLLKKALTDPRGYGDKTIHIDDNILNLISNFACGDARNALSTLEMVILNGNVDKNGEIFVSEDTFEQCTGQKVILYDKNGDGYFDMISALHKSMRNSDPDAAIYWLARMLEAGENPLVIARRVIRFSSEDIGMADPKALEIAVAAYNACHYIGVPECNVCLTEAVVYMSLAPKSNSLYMAYNSAQEDALNSINEPVPYQLRNASTSLEKQLGYGQGYIYAHNTEDKIANLQCLPNNLKDKQYYIPGSQGYEPNYQNRLNYLKDKKSKS